MDKITIKHQIEGTEHIFEVVDETKLTAEEVNQICEELNASAIFVAGRYYERKS